MNRINFWDFFIPIHVRNRVCVKTKPSVNAWLDSVDFASAKALISEEYGRGGGDRSQVGSAKSKTRPTCWQRAFEVLHSDLGRILVSVLVSVGLLVWGTPWHIVAARDFRM